MRWGSITVSGSSSMIAFTSGRTKPRPSEIFCLPSAVSPEARERSIGPRSSSSAISRTRAPTLGSATPRFRSGNARLSCTVIVS